MQDSGPSAKGRTAAGANREVVPMQYLVCFHAGS
jgi:hypothetical protein